ncbi:MFS transporter [Spongiactinospora rosea]|uniref:MFS transporter n=1 Tax=Spongiactinospora rosea TaxID=2248750 RepID=UPI0011C05FCC|nr:MFS transporter [Spongiactinospora rosea]
MGARLPLRCTRAAAFSAVCVILAALGHRLAGGAGPVPWAMAAGGGGALLTALALAGRERSTSTISLVLMGLQLGLHELFSFASGAASSLTPHEYIGLPPQPSAADPHPHEGPGGTGLGMLVAHLAASLITGLWLARGEAVLWSVLRHLGAAARRAGAAALARLLGAPPYTGRGPLAVPLPAREPRAVPGRGPLHGAVARRGPPLPRF